MNIDKNEREIPAAKPEESSRRVQTTLFELENNEPAFKDLLSQTFKDEAWLNVFLSDSHHGYKHGDQVREACLKLMDNLNETEKEKLTQEGKNINVTDSDKWALLAIELAAIFHDCGRFNEKGEVIAEEQLRHHILSSQRAQTFCHSLGLDPLIPRLEEAILCHDFQSKEFTPNLESPQSIIGKLVQAADQMGWFHPDSVNRTLRFNRELGVPFYEQRISLAERLAWNPRTKANDALTVMLAQLCGHTGTDRFGIEFAQKKVELYKKDLELSILDMAETYQVKDEVRILIEEYKKHNIATLTNN